jgi:hypothetical protein
MKAKIRTTTVMTMNEIVPVMAGAAIGVLVPRFIPPHWRAWTLAFLSVLCGAAASWTSGELAIAPGYLLIDAAQVAFGGIVAWTLAARIRDARTSSSFSQRLS